jgi:hypothetical protein
MLPKGPEKKRIIISKSAKKGTEMVVYHSKTKRGIRSETCHEVVGPKSRPSRG